MLETKYKDITYNSKEDLWTLETDIYYILENKWDVVGFDYEKDIKRINEQLDLYDLWLWQYMLESNSIDYLNNLKNNLENNWTEIKWFFERNTKNYLILYKPEINWEIDFNFNELKDKVDNIIK
jgi:hypothetical protein